MSSQCQMFGKCSALVADFFFEGLYLKKKKKLYIKNFNIKKKEN